MSKELIADPRYWRRRLREAQANDRLWQSVYLIVEHKWRLIERRHRDILGRLVGPTDSVLDAGCGYGRLLTLMPKSWIGPYLGIDISPDFLELAGKTHDRLFQQIDLRDLSELAVSCDSGEKRVYDWAVLISIRPMIVRGLGQEVWDTMEVQLRRVARKLLYLEYDEAGEGSIE